MFNEKTKINKKKSTQKKRTKNEKRKIFQHPWITPFSSMQIQKQKIVCTWEHNNNFMLHFFCFFSSKTIFLVVCMILYDSGISVYSLSFFLARMGYCRFNKNRKKKTKLYSLEKVAFCTNFFTCKFRLFFIFCLKKIIIVTLTFALWYWYLNKHKNTNIKKLLGS